MRIFRNKVYEEHLEREVKRLQSENRQLVNSILAVAGVPGIAEEKPDQPVSPMRGSTRWRDIGRTMTQRTREAFSKLAPVYQAEAEKKANG